MIRRILALGVVLVALMFGGAVRADVQPTAHAYMINSQGERVGVATLYEATGGVHVHLEVHDLPPGLHGCHIHNVGKADPPDFKSAGGHFNPDHHQHGLQNPQGYHLGDLPNLSIAVNGTGTMDFLVQGANLRTGDHSLFHEGGTSIVIHAHADDEVTDPVGNAGARIACGVIEPNGR